MIHISPLLDIEAKPNNIQYNSHVAHITNKVAKELKCLKQYAGYRPLFSNRAQITERHSGKHADYGHSIPDKGRFRKRFGSFKFVKG